MIRESASEYRVAVHDLLERYRVKPAWGEWTPSAPDRIERAHAAAWTRLRRMHGVVASPIEREEQDEARRHERRAALDLNVQRLLRSIRTAIENDRKRTISLVSQRSYGRAEAARKCHEAVVLAEWASRRAS